MSVSVPNIASLRKIGFYSIKEVIESDGVKEFYVAPYQRGYRWGEIEIDYLLNDIWKAPENRKYCLQPVSVIEKEDGTWELVDGQQRLTTIYLILALLKNQFRKDNQTFNITYNTRETTAQFLQQVREDDILGTWVGNEGEISDLWHDFIQSNSDKDNIDNYHLFQAYLTTHRWFDGKSEEVVRAFPLKLLEQTYIIWHPLALQGESVEDRFININAGKIKLTNAELIKALFILKLQVEDESWNIKQIRKKQLAEEWDAIEKQLHDDDFWYFLHQSDTEDFQTRIGLLFDLLSAKRKGKQSAYDWFAEDDSRLDWEAVLNLNHRLLEWYNDVGTYHKIGFMINTGIKTLKDLSEETIGLPKSEIKQQLESFIKGRIQSTKQREGQQVYRYHLDKLSYEDKTEDCKTLLLLYNIVLLENTFPGQRIPFHLYRKESWSLEHLHPQNPGKIKSIQHAFAWLEDFECRTDELEGSQKEEIVKDLKTLKEKLQASTKDKLSQDVQEEMSAFTEKYKDDFDLHGIGNLALLDKHTNSALGNLPFKEKRDIILQPSNDHYIPIGTLDCFLKKYSPKAHLQMEYWSDNDIEAYRNSITHYLKEYLPNVENQQ